VVTNGSALLAANKLRVPVKPLSIPVRQENGGQNGAFSDTNNNFESRMCLQSAVHTDSAVTITFSEDVGMPSACDVQTFASQGQQNGEACDDDDMFIDIDYEEPDSPGLIHYVSSEVNNSGMPVGSDSRSSCSEFNVGATEVVSVPEVDASTSELPSTPEIDSSVAELLSTPEEG